MRVSKRKLASRRSAEIGRKIREAKQREDVEKGQNKQDVLLEGTAASVDPDQTEDAASSTPVERMVQEYEPVPAPSGVAPSVKRRIEFEVDSTVTRSMQQKDTLPENVAEMDIEASLDISGPFGVQSLKRRSTCEPESGPLKKHAGIHWHSTPKKDHFQKTEGGKDPLSDTSINVTLPDLDNTLEDTYIEPEGPDEFSSEDEDDKDVKRSQQMESTPQIEMNINDSLLDVTLVDGGFCMITVIPTPIAESGFEDVESEKPEPMVQQSDTDLMESETSNPDKEYENICCLPHFDGDGKDPNRGTFIPNKSLSKRLAKMLQVDAQEKAEEEETDAADTSINSSILRKEKIEKFITVKNCNNSESAKNADICLVEMACLNKLCSRLKLECPSCKEVGIQLRTKKTDNRRMVQSIELYCTKCNKIRSSVQTSTKTYLPEGMGNPWVYTVPLRVSRAILDTGMGYARSRDFFAALNHPPLSDRAFQQHIIFYNKAYALQVQKVLKGTAQSVIHDYIEKGIEPEDGLMNIAVTYDGTWMTRGYDSLIGVGIICDAETGSVLDFEILGKFCPVCAQFKRKKKKMNMAKIQIKKWKKEHQIACQKTFSTSRSSGAMEAEIAKILFARSKDLGLRYTTMISDEDSSTYKQLVISNPYGDNFPIRKQNCLNHLNKKIYKELEKIMKLLHFRDLGDGMQTDKIAEIFANFYRMYIKKYIGNFVLIRRYVLASVLHYAATDDEPMHDLCHQGKASLCKYQRDIANGLVPGKGWHADKENRKYSLNINIAKAIFNLFIERLSTRVLSLTSSKTQNVNESLHSRLWGIINKATFKSVKHVRYTMSKIVIEHNLGVESYDVFDDLNVGSGTFTRKRRTEREKRRTTPLKNSWSKKMRKVLRKKRKDDDEDYMPGGH